MKKVLPVLILISFLIVPMAGLAQVGPVETLKSCKLGHDWGNKLCGSATKLPKDVTITEGGTVKCCEATPAGTPLTATCKDVSMICLVDLISTIGDWVFVILLVLAVIFVLLGAFQFITAGGNPEGMKSAKQKLIYAVVGLTVAFLAKGVIRLIEQFIV